MSTPPKNVILQGDCAEVLKTIPDASVDAVVSDPPYGLGTREPTGEEIDEYLAGARLDTGGDFMGKEWDIPPVRVWVECMRALKPGGILMAFAGTRTWDIMHAGIEAAGFVEHRGLRDKFGVSMLQWIHGQGFPKSLDISKAIDKILRAFDLPKLKIEHFMANKAAAGLPSELVEAPKNDETWGKIREALNVTLDEEIEFEKGLVLTTKASKKAVSEAVEEGAAENAPPGELRSELAKKWKGWGTALKPSWEPVLVFYKPGGPEPIQFQENLDAPFYYTAKVSKSEATLGGEVENNHPTRKPLALMRWLVKLAAPKGALILDPYCGSGTTCVAATEEDQCFIGVERDPQFHAIAEKRVGIVHTKAEEARGQRAVFSFMDEMPQE